jgi:NAD(P)-dependent dehydrogenase (short-subunit alcohol dehydrogenase family)
MDLKAQGLSALVTGGTRGIGRAVVEAFLDEGVNVAFCARDADAVVSTTQELSGRGARAFGSSVDVGDAAALSAWVDASAKELGGVDIVVSNVSALAIPDTDENWEASLNVDLMGTVRLVKASMPYLEKSKAGSIVTVSSVSGREVDFASGPYGTVKTALVGYTQGLAFQLAGKGIRANTVSPGNTFFEGGVWEQIKEGNRELYDMALGLNPTGRMGTPEEMAAAVVFLASPVSSFTTGTNLVVDGALTRGVHL